MGVHDRHQYRFADGLRGLAALQVVLLHCASVFLPFFAHESGASRFPFERWLAGSPFLFLVDGGSAVCLFFIISGFVLANSFRSTPLTAVALIGKRTTRLGVPVIIGWLLAVLLTSLLPLDKASLVTDTDSDFVRRLFIAPLTLAHAFRDLFANSMLLGYEQLSLFTNVPLVPLQNIGTSVNPPFWTLHVEFWGSILTIGLTKLERRLPKASLPFVAAGALMLTGTGFYSLFVLGWSLNALLASTGRGNLQPPARPVIGLALVITGVYVAVSKHAAVVATLQSAIELVTIGRAVNAATFQASFGSFIAFTGVLVTPAFQSLFRRSPFTFLGRMSFGIYLFHFPILFSLATITFVALQPGGGYLLASAVATLVGLLLTFGAAFGFDRWVDPRVIAMSHRVGATLDELVCRRVRGRSTVRGT